MEAVRDPRKSVRGVVEPDKLDRGVVHQHDLESILGQHRDALPRSQSGPLQGGPEPPRRRPRLGIAHLPCRVGAEILRRALEEPTRQLVANAGLEGSVVIEELRREKGKKNWGFDVVDEKYVDLVQAGIIDPAKVTRSALENAASVAGMILTTEALVTELPEKKSPAGAPGGAPDMYD